MFNILDVFFIDGLKQRENILMLFKIDIERISLHIATKGVSDFFISGVIDRQE